MAYSIVRRLYRPLLQWRISSLSGLAHIPMNGPAILVANHVSEQDALLLGTAIIPYTRGRKLYTIAKWKILQFPLWQKWLGVIPLLEDRAKTIELTKKLLEQGELVLIFPEGGLNNNPAVNKVKTGAARLALATKAPVIPIGLRRTSPAPKTDFALFLEIAYGRLHISIGEPTDLSPWYNRPIDRTVLNEINRVIMEKVTSLANKTYQP